MIPSTGLAKGVSLLGKGIKFKREFVMKLKKILGITGLAVASTVALAACGAGGNKSERSSGQKKA